MLISPTVLCTTEYISWQNQVESSGVFRPVSITMMVSRAGNTTHGAPKNKIFCKHSIQVNKYMQQRSDRGGCSNQNHRFVYVWWGLCDHLIRNSLSNHAVSIYLQRMSDMLEQRGVSRAIHTACCEPLHPSNLHLQSVTALISPGLWHKSIMNRVDLIVNWSWPQKQGSQKVYAIKMLTNQLKLAMYNFFNRQTRHEKDIRVPHMYVACIIHTHDHGRAGHTTSDISERPKSIL